MHIQIYKRGNGKSSCKPVNLASPSSPILQESRFKYSRFVKPSKKQKGKIHLQCVWHLKKGKEIEEIKPKKNCESQV